jgi:hypothetical protein
VSSGFSPSLQKESGKGFRIVHGAYPDGVAGVKLSLETIAQHIRAGAKSPAVQGWAYDQLLACGLKGRDGPPPFGQASNRAKASCLLDAIRKVTIYTADPPNVEMVKSAEAQLCLRPGLCIRGGDCFVEGTLIQTDQGIVFPQGSFSKKYLRPDSSARPIESLQEGERIWGLNRWTTVKRVWPKGVLRYSAITLDDGLVLPLTADHHVFRVNSPAGFERVTVRSLEPGAILIRPAHPVGEETDEKDFSVRRVTAVAHDVGEARCYDITTEDGFVYLPEHDVTVSNCDDMVILTGSAMMSVGIPTRVVKQTFSGPSQQEHVLVRSQDDDGSWFYMDPSTELPVGSKYPSSEEFELDPSNPSMIGLKGAPEAEFVGIGRVERFLGANVKKPCSCHGKCGPCSKGPGSRGLAGLPPRTIGAVTALPAAVLPQSGAFAQSAADFRAGFILPIQAGDIYYNAGQYADAITAYKAAGQTGATTLGPEIDLGGAAAVTQKFTQEAWAINSALQNVSGSTQQSADLARWHVFTMFLLYQRALAAGQAAGGKRPGVTPNASLWQAGAWAVGGGMVVGLAWEWITPHVKQHARRWL